MDGHDAAAYEGARLSDRLLDKTNTAAVVWADSAYRSAANEDYLATNGFVSRINRKKLPGKPMPERTRGANAASQGQSRIPITLTSRLPIQYTISLV